MKGSLDVELALDAALGRDQYDTLFLVSGDSDFAPLLDKLQAFGKRTTVISAKGHVAHELLQRAGYLNLAKFRQCLARGEL